jgi:tetratricopeptide (TPR) repeat protein
MNTPMRRMLALTCGAVTMTCALLAQGGPAPKSAKERDAIIAVQSATTPDDRLKAIESVLTNFADTQFKVILLQMAMQTALQKDDYAATTLYAERLLEADPKNPFAEVTLAGEIPRHTREFDLDKEEKLTKADKYAHAAIENIATAPKPQPNMPDEQWAGMKKDTVAQAHDALGMIATLRKNYDQAIAEYNIAITSALRPDPSDYVRLGQAEIEAGKLDDANAASDKAIADANASERVKQIARDKKAEVAKRKAAAGGSTPAPPKP